MAEVKTLTMNPALSLFEGVSNISVMRQAGLLLGLAASVALGFWVVLWTKEASFIPLYTDVSHLDANQISDLLQSEKIKFKIDTNTNMLLVAADKVHEARLKLAASGLPSGLSQGYELLDKDTGFGTSQFLETARYNRSLEGELAKTIASVHAVRSARVHLAIPKRSVFLSDKRAPTASVFVNVFPGQKLGSTQVEAITHLVASSISELTQENVTVIDQKGKLLSSDIKDEALALADKNMGYKKKIEEAYIARIENILEPVLGRDRFRVQLTVAMDFTQIEKTSEAFNPDIPALRSERSLQENQMGAGNGPSGVPGALSNTPPATGQAPETLTLGEGETPIPNSQGPGNTRNQSTRNYELDRTISYTKNAVGMMQRLSVAVVVDDFIQKIGEGKDQEIVKTPIPADELLRLTRLVKDAVGFDAIRGDRVNVLNQPFIDKDILEEEPIPELPFYKQDWFNQLIKQIMSGLLLLVLLMGVLRPMLKNLAQLGHSSQIIEEDTMEIMQESEVDDAKGIEEMQKEMEILLPGPEQSYEAQLNAIKNMVADDPRRVAQVVKQWLLEDG